MSENIMQSDNSYVNATPDEVYRWADRAGETGNLNPTTAKLKSTAMKRVLTVLAEEEQLGAQEILDKLDGLVTRLARKEGGNPETLSTYKQRTESLLRDFLEYHRDPLAFQKSNAERPVKPPAEKKKKPETKNSSVSPPTDDVSEPAPRTGARRYVYPLGEGRDFEYVLPAGGLNMREVKKVALLLISLANDYEPHGDTVADLTRRVRQIEGVADDESELGRGH